MEVRVCKVCKKMFQYITGPEICPTCRKKEEEYFQLVKEYLREHPGADMVEVNDKTGVSISLIEKFLRAGRLQVTADSPIALTCERCGRKIFTGRLCSECKNQITSELNQIKESLIKDTKEDNKDARMRYLHFNK